MQEKLGKKRGAQGVFWGHKRTFQRGKEVQRNNRKMGKEKFKTDLRYAGNFSISAGGCNLVPACGEMWIRFRLLVQLSIYVIPFRSKNFLQELTERTVKYLISIRCSVYRRIKQSNLPISRKISSLFNHYDFYGFFVSLSGCFVRPKP